MTRMVNAGLLLAFVVGLYGLVRERETLARVRSERDDLAIKYGMLEIKDAKKYMITRVETGDPAHLLWRCHYPEQLNVKERQGFGIGGSTSGSRSRSAAGEFLQRCRFEFSETQITAHVMDRGGWFAYGSWCPSLLAKGT
ncbi:MAG: hypothetical protein AB8B91_11530 [Rubripirellula sp.]